MRGADYRRALQGGARCSTRRALPSISSSLTP